MRCGGLFDDHFITFLPVVKVVLWSRGGAPPDEARLEQTPYPFHIQLIWRYLHGGHKITFYRFNQGAHTMQGAQIGAGDWAPWPPQFSHWCLLLSLAVKEFWESVKNGKVMGKSIGCPVYFAPRGIYFDHRAKFGHVGGPKNMRILTRVPLRTGCVTPRNTPFSRVSWQIWLFWSNRMTVNDRSAEKNQAYRLSSSI